MFLFLLWTELKPRFFILSIIPLSRVFVSLMDGAQAEILHSFHHSSVTCFCFSWFKPRFFILSIIPLSRVFVFLFLTCFCFSWMELKEILHSFHHSSVTCFCFSWLKPDSFLCLSLGDSSDSSFHHSSVTCFCFYYGRSSGRDSSFFPSFLCHVFLFLLWTELKPRFFILSIIPLSRVFVHSSVTFLFLLVMELKPRFFILSIIPLSRVFVSIMLRFFILSIIPLSRVFVSIMDGAQAVILHSFHHSSVTCFLFLL